MKLKQERIAHLITLVQFGPLNDKNVTDEVMIFKNTRRQYAW